MIIVNSTHTASFDVDAQKTFSPLCPDELPVADALAIVPALNQQANFARLRLGSKDAHTRQAVWLANDSHPAFSPGPDINADTYWPAHAIAGSMGFELLDGLPTPLDYDYFVWKGIEPNLHPYGACFHDNQQQLSTGVIEFLQREHIDTVLVGGLATDYCVKATALQLQAAGLRVIVNLAATRAVNAETEADALQHMQAHGITLITDTEELSQGD